MKKMKPFRLKASHHMIFETASKNNAKEVELIFESNREILELINYQSPTIEAKKFIENNDLPPYGKKEHSYRFVIREIENKKAIGILGYYCGYPSLKDLYIGDLFIKSELRGKGIGESVLKTLEGEAFDHNMENIFVNIGGKNWDALRFWVKNGFNQITKCSGDIASKGAIELKKELC